MNEYFVSTMLFATAFLCSCTSDGGFNSADVKPYSNFQSGKILLDNNGRHVNAHGAGFIFDNGRYYMFGEHKLGGTLGNKSVVGVHCYSSDDLYNWRDEGIALKMSRNPESKIFIGTVLERPKVLFNDKTKKYVMFMHLEFRRGATRKSPDLNDIYNERSSYTSNNIGFAVADNVAGPYEFVRSTRLHAKKFPVNADADLRKKVSQRAAATKTGTEKPTGAELFAADFENGQMSQDFTAFKDDDGKAYVFSASEGDKTLYVSELSDDYLSFTGKYTRNMPDQYHEAPAVFKTRGKYYMFSSHCTGWRPNAGRVSVADSVFGPWSELGNPCRGDGQNAPRFGLAGGVETAFRSQSTAVIKVDGKSDAFIYVGDRWMPDDAIDARYVFLPVEWDGGMPVLKWKDSWNLSFFDDKPNKFKLYTNP